MKWIWNESLSYLTGQLEPSRIFWFAGPSRSANHGFRKREELSYSSDHVLDKGVTGIREA